MLRFGLQVATRPLSLPQTWLWTVGSMPSVRSLIPILKAKHSESAFDLS